MLWSVISSIYILTMNLSTTSFRCTPPARFPHFLKSRNGALSSTASGRFGPGSTIGILPNIALMFVLAVVIEQASGLP